ncbi:MAG: thioredoxin family protein [Brevinematales bacterium]|nr:thioredoxin family protein [Brevinematales bacterium]
MKLQILGTGCARCNMLEANVRAAAAEAGIDAEVEKVSDLDRIMDMGVMITPAFAIDGTVVSAGKILTKEQVIQMIGEK